MIVAHDQLNPETLRALIEEFVTRDGAVQGHKDMPVEQKLAEVMRQLELGTAVIVYDEDDESCSIVPKDRAGSDGPVEELPPPAE